MKKFLLLSLLSFLFFSCEKDVIPNEIDNYQLGGFATFKGSVVKTADFQNGAGAIKFTVEDPNGNAVKYRIYKIASKIQGVAYPAVATNFTFTSFPANVNIPLASLATVFGLTQDDLYYGDSFTFYAEVTTSDGRVFQGENPYTTGALPVLNNTTAALTSSSFGYKQAMQFSITVACPNYSQADMLGTYAAGNDPFVVVPTGHTFQCVAGPAANQLKFVNWTDEGKDLIVTIDPVAQTATVAKQEAWYHPTYLWASVEGSGLVFSCIGTLNIDLKHTVAAGSFGTYNVTLEKQ
ncbi:hypothetical protein [Flavobacterium branchiophilum]|uniref:Lipoprotein n=1 Tax=Flavobacterium branchiophilum TaxID=55197 RepID=A0A2H3KG07_9FLAO|nr:hypothetical protein [Flavobacterium branchiophilum]PDS26525.1 hypothetical protein B0A77_02180 [Flavobacterium branchiophilum]